MLVVTIWMSYHLDNLTDNKLRFLVIDNLFCKTFRLQFLVQTFYLLIIKKDLTTSAISKKLETSKIFQATVSPLSLRKHGLLCLCAPHLVWHLRCFHDDHKDIITCSLLYVKIILSIFSYFSPDKKVVNFSLLLRSRLTKRPISLILF